MTGRVEAALAVAGGAGLAVALIVFALAWVGHCRGRL